MKHRIERGLPDFGFGAGQGQSQSLLAEFGPAMPGGEEFFELGQQDLAVRLDGRLGKWAQVFDLADQMGQAKLNRHATWAGVFAIGPQKSAPKIPAKFRPNRSINTSEPREGSILKTMRALARKHLVQ